MRKNGFTLIELLAVIVILAIIALIATPIILGIINDVREKANERSVELYASAVRNGIAAHQLRTGNEVLPGTYNESNPLPFEPDYDGNVKCTNIIISEDGKVSLDKCTVNGGTKEYSYGMEENTIAKVCTIERQDESKYSVGDVVSCLLNKSTEKFYVIENQDDDNTPDTVDMLAMYNLNVGDNKFPNEATYGLQESGAKGAIFDDDYNIIENYSIVEFSSNIYWIEENGADFSFSVDSNYEQEGREYPYVYNETNDVINPIIDEYVGYLNEKGLGVSGRLLSYEETTDLGCIGENCSDAYEWLYSTSYWLGSSSNSDSSGYMWYIQTDFTRVYNDPLYVQFFGVRPVITLPIDNIE